MTTASKQADGWLCGNIVDTPYGDGKVLHVHGRDSADLIIQVRIVTPRSSNPSYGIVSKIFRIPLPSSRENSAGSAAPTTCHGW